MALTFLQSAVDGTDLTTYTFASQNLGTASSDRYIIAGITGRGVGTLSLSSVTIGGVSATLIANTANTSSNTTVASLAIAAVPTGTTGDVVVTFSAGFLRCGIALWSATGLASATPTDSSGSTAAAPTYAIDVVAGGFAIGCAYTANTSTATWTNITEKYDQAVEGAGSAHTGASDTFGSTQTNLALTCTFTASLTPAGAFASWELASAATPRSNFLLLGIS